MWSPCMGCGSNDTEMVRNADGRFVKVCEDCDHVGGPFVSQQQTSGQTTLGNF